MLITQTACEVFVIPSMSDLLDSARLPRVTRSEPAAHGCVQVNKTQMFLKKKSLYWVTVHVLLNTYTPLSLHHLPQKIVSKVLSVWSDCELELIQCLRLTNTSNSDYTVERNNKFPMAPTK